MTPIEINDCPFYLITRASLAVTSWFKRSFESADVAVVRPSYLPALMSLWRDDGQKLVDLGRGVGLEPSTMTGLVDRMERDGLVERTPDPRDRRAQRICLTAEGRRVRPIVETIVEESLAQLLDGVSAENLERARIALRTLLANADKGRTP
jgi:DNA-binding MarR family transcriptional regulator